MKLAIMLCMLCAIARADDYMPPAYLEAPPALPPGFDEHSVWRLDLDSALTIAVKQNLGVTLARQQLEMVRLGGVATEADLSDPTISANYTHAGSDSPPPTLQAGLPGSTISSTADGWSLSLGQRFATGATVSLGLNSSRTDSSSGAAPEPLNYLTGLSFSVKQPLLRGFSPDLVIPKMAILTAELGTATARHDVALKATVVVQQTETAYWGVVQELYAYGLALKAQQLAEDTVAHTARMIAAGQSPEADLVGVKSTLAQAKLAVLAELASIDTASDALRVALNLPRDQWSRPLLPTERPHFEPAKVTSEDDALAIAAAHRPELAEADLGLKASLLAIRAADNNRLPDISVGLSAALAGQDATLGGAIGQLRDNPGWQVTLDLAWTPLGRAAKARAGIARIQHEINTGNRELLVQTIWTQVRSAIREQRAAALRLTAASEARLLANESLEIENHRYATGGTATPITIATRQHDLAAAELGELQALLGHQRAATALLAATGQLLEHRRIVLR